MPLRVRRTLARLPLLALLVATLLLGGCIKRVRDLPEAGRRETMAVYEGYPVPAAPPDPTFATFTRTQAQTSLQRLVVVPFGWSVYIEKEPQALLTQAQVQRYATILARELPRLKPGERIEFGFSDHIGGGVVTMDVYPDGAYLVYAFRELMLDPSSLQGEKAVPRPGGRIEPQPGQIIRQSSPNDAVRVHDPVRADALNAAVARGERLALIDDALKQKVIAEDEAERLRKALDTRAALPLAVWKTYFQKRTLLQKSFNEQLIEAPAYEQTRKRLEAELTGS